MAVRVGRMYGKKRTFGYPKSYGGGSKEAETAAPSVGQKSPQQGAKAAFDRAEPVKSAFTLLSAKVTKSMRRIRC